MFGAIEAGGTKFVCGVGTGPEDLTTIQFPTTSPDVTLAQAIEFLRKESRGELEAVGIGSFGPIDLHSTSLTFGYVTSTPKVGWQNYNLAGTVRDALGVPVGFDTDVDAAALGEARWGAAQNLTDFVYLTVGTGIGGGAIINGRVLHGLVHPEMGHIRRIRAAARTTETAWKDWPPVRPCRPVGARRPRICPRITQLGYWRRTIWRTDWRTGCSRCRHSALCWAEEWHAKPSSSDASAWIWWDC